MSIRAMLAAALMAIPWVNPWARGPLPSVEPLLISLLCMLLLLCLYRSEDRSRIAPVWVAVGVISSGIAVCQYFGWAGYFSPWMNLAPAGEAFANLRQRNLFATLTNIAQAALWFELIRVKRRPSVLVLVGAGLLAVGTALSTSRTGLLELFLLGLFIWYWRLRRAVPGSVDHALWRVLGVAVFGYALASWAGPYLSGVDVAQQGVWGRFGSPTSGCESRRTLWANVLHLIAQKPWTGWGWGELSYAHYITSYPQLRFCAILDNAHNLPLHLAVELGIPAALLICAALGYLVWRARPWKETNPTRQLAWTVLALIGLHSLLEYPLWYGPFQLAVGLCVWILVPWPACLHAGRPVMLSQENAGPCEVLLSPLGGGRSRASAWGLRVQRWSAGVLLVVLSSVSFSYYCVSQIYLPVQERDAKYRDDPALLLFNSAWFANTAQFAMLVGSPVTEDNAALVHELALALLHHSPEPKVIEQVVMSARLLGLHDDVLLHQARYQAAFPEDYARWVQASTTSRTSASGALRSVALPGPSSSTN